MTKEKKKPRVNLSFPCLLHVHDERLGRKYDLHIPDDALQYIDHKDIKTTITVKTGEIQKRPIPPLRFHRGCMPL